MIRVLHILNVLKPSGAEAMLASAAPIWRKSGIELQILSTGDVIGPYEGELRAAGYAIDHLPFSKSLGYFHKLYTYLRKNRPDVVHIHPERANFYHALVVWLSLSARIIRTVHNTFRFTGRLRLTKILERRIMTHLFGVTFVSIGESVRREEADRFLNATITIPNWYDSLRYMPRPTPAKRELRSTLGLPIDRLILVSLGGCWEYKNHTAILDALALLRSDKLYYVHIGQEGSERKELLYATNLGIGHQVNFLGIVDDPLPYLHAADVYIMPSIYEGFGVAAAEAMGAGLPAILTDVPGLRDFKSLGPGIYWAQPTCQSISEAMARIEKIPPSQLVDLGTSLSRVVAPTYGLSVGAIAHRDLYLSAEHLRGHDRAGEGTVRHAPRSGD
jgi:glycosyltransferase involved in cell wall biosynthesis